MFGLPFYGVGVAPTAIPATRPTRRKGATERRHAERRRRS